MGLPYYKRYTGDYARDTRDLTLIEHGAYTLLLDHYYATGCLEQCLEQCFRLCMAFTPDEQQAVRNVLDKFFVPAPSGKGYIHERVEKEIEKQSTAYNNRVNVAKLAATSRWRKKLSASIAPSNASSNASSIEKSCQPEPDKNINVFRDTPAARSQGTRLDRNWEPDDESKALAKKILGPHGGSEELEKFRDYWTAQAGQRGRKLDWNATYRNWIRRASESRQKGNNNHQATGVANIGEKASVASSNGRYYVKQDTPQWNAWTKFKGKPLHTDRDGGWMVESEWPPNL